MRDRSLTVFGAPAERQAVTVVRARNTEYLRVEHDPLTGDRLKFYSRAADIAYWTGLWKSHGGVSYEREQLGHLPHQLRTIVRRWVKPEGRVLEAGCGLGHFTIAANALGYRAEGVDWSEETIATLRRGFPHVRWHVGDVRQLVFADASFDAVYSPGVCEHFEEGPADVLVEMHRILRPGGIGVVSTPCFNPWLQRRAGRLSSGLQPYGVEFYQYAFTWEGMSRLLEQLGFAVVQVRPYAALDTLIRYGGWDVPRVFRTPLAFAIDYVPILRRWGSVCLWVARKC